MTTSQAAKYFAVAIKDAEDLLAHVESLGNPLPQSADVFKRAGLVMAMTAWETYVEDRVLEFVKLTVSETPSLAEQFMIDRLTEELKRLHNPTSEKTRKLFRDYTRIDVPEQWSIGV